MVTTASQREARMSAVEHAPRATAMNDNDREWTRRRPREWGIGNIIASIAAMGVMMAVITLTLHRNFPLVATGPSISASEPSTTGQGGIVPVRGRGGIER
jgi:hypothetical protein